MLIKQFVDANNNKVFFFSYTSFSLLKFTSYLFLFYYCVYSPFIAFVCWCMEAFPCSFY